MIALRNEYESQLLQKDVELRKRDEILERIRQLVGNGNGSPAIITQSSNISMWLEKLGNGGTSRILKFLADKSGLKFTRSQIGLAVGLAPSSGSFSTYMATLKRNRLIIEQNREVWINPDL